MVNAKVFGERRLYQRKPCAFPITIENRDSAYLAYIRNLSLGGAFVERPKERKIKTGENVTLTIPFQHRVDSVTIRGKISRIEGEGMGIVFQK